MISFLCGCGERHEAPLELAGQEIQCPRCLLLVTIPHESDLAGIGEDGAYRLDADAVPMESLDDLASLIDVYGRMKPGADLTDATDIPLAPPAPIGAADSLEELRRAARPRYDPETGERIVEIPFAHAPGTEAKPVIPIAAPAVAYAANGAISTTPASHMLLDLVRPASAMVLLSTLGVHVLLAVMWIPVAFQFYLAAPFFAALLIVLISHYGNVVEEIAVEERDELPRVLRDARIGEDIWRPLVSMVGGAILCLWPGYLLITSGLLSPASRISLSAALLLVGAFAFPAVLLTMLTSGSVLNLRPDRVLGVIYQSGVRYCWVFAAFALASIPYAWGTAGTMAELARRVHIPVDLPGWSTSFPLTLPLLCLGIFGFHVACWQLGLIYRRSARKFPWPEHAARTEPRPPPPRNKPRYVAPTPFT